ncbi:MAG: hypothetical protein WD381_03260 [Balneolaceae bacterium]
MSNRDTDSIKYVLNEMDPSERIEFERRIVEDSDLLIEVESIRRMEKRLSALPLFHPPKKLSHSIYEKSGEYNALLKRRDRNKKLSLAAVVLVISLSGSMLFMGESDDVPDQFNSAGIQSPPLQQSTVTKSNNRVQPWVDNNQIIHFTGGSENTGFTMDNSDLQSSYQKLQPVNNPSVKQYFHRNLHLTGSGN